MNERILTMPAHETNMWSRNGQRIEYIVLHYVGAVSTAVNNGHYYGTEPNIGASAHYFVDEHNIVVSVPEDMSAGHCGVDYSGGKAPFWGKCRCKNSIGIEMCCKKDAAGRWYIEPETVTRTVALVRWLMQKHAVDADHVIRHYDVCGKICPEPWVRDSAQWADFQRRIREQKSDGKRYNTVDECPVWARGAVQTLLDEGWLRGRDNGQLDLSDDMLRTLVICGRMQGVIA